MNLFDKLMNADLQKVNETKKGKSESKRLAEILGEDEPVTIVIRELTSREVARVNEYVQGKNGEVDAAKAIDGNAYICAKGIVEPDVRSKELQEYFGVSNAKDLCEKLLRADVNAIASDILALSGYGEDDLNDEEDIKNW